jgi:hypothetical protein
LRNGDILNFRQADSAIFNAFCGGLVICIWMAFQSFLLLVYANSETLWIAILSLLGVVIFGILTYGLHHKSRLSAILILLLFVPYQLFGLVQRINLWGIVALIGLGIVFFQGIIGTIVYQKVRQQQQLNNNAN